jgi:hypothetical protein
VFFKKTTLGSYLIEELGDIVDQVMKYDPHLLALALRVFVLGNFFQGEPLQTFAGHGGKFNLELENLEALKNVE